MQVFLSWSGERSRAVAEQFARWLSQVIQTVEPWISTDIEKGTRWGPAVADRLEQCRVGIICLTPENLESKWILFEAGALSKTKEAYVCTLLLGLTSTDVEPPLAQFQHTTVEKDDIERLLRTVNAAVAQSGERALTEHVLTQVFNTFWPQLEDELRRIAATSAPAAPPTRSEADILDEILTTVRNLDRRQSVLEVNQLSQQLSQLTSWDPFRKRQEVVYENPKISDADLVALRVWQKLQRAKKSTDVQAAAEDKPKAETEE
jgi:hypothetical protein